MPVPGRSSDSLQYDYWMHRYLRLSNQKLFRCNTLSPRLPTIPKNHHGLQDSEDTVRETKRSAVDSHQDGPYRLQPMRIRREAAGNWIREKNTRPGREWNLEKVHAWRFFRIRPSMAGIKVSLLFPSHSHIIIIMPSFLPIGKSSDFLPALWHPETNSSLRTGSTVWMGCDVTFLHHLLSWKSPKKTAGRLIPASVPVNPSHPKTWIWTHSCFFFFPLSLAVRQDLVSFDPNCRVVCPPGHVFFFSGEREKKRTPPLGMHDALYCMQTCQSFLSFTFFCNVFLKKTFSWSSIYQSFFKYRIWHLDWYIYKG